MKYKEYMLYVRLFGITLLAFTSGCASLHSKMYERVHGGDSQWQVIQALGQPDAYEMVSRESNENALYYRSRGDVCGIILKDDKVIETECMKDPNYLTPIQVFAKSFSESTAASSANSRRTVTCVGNTVGGNTLVNCN